MARKAKKNGATTQRIENTQDQYRVTGKPVKLGKATLQRRADPLTARDMVSGEWKAEERRDAGGILLNGQHTFLETMPQASWFKVRTVKGKRQVFLTLHFTGLQPIEYGPFPDESRALWMLDRMYNGMLDYLYSPEEFDNGPWTQEEARRKSTTCLCLVE
jgi:hypothetical protein